MDTPWTVAKPGKGRVLATVPVIYNRRGFAVAHVLGGMNAAEEIVTAVNAHAELVAALELPLLFHSATWNKKDSARWKEITGTDEATNTWIEHDDGGFGNRRR